MKHVTKAASHVSTNN